MEKKLDTLCIHGADHRFPEAGTASPFPSTKLLPLPIRIWATARTSSTIPA